MEKWAVTRLDGMVALAVTAGDLSPAETERLLDSVRGYVEDRSVAVVEVVCDLDERPSFGLTGMLAALEGQVEAAGKRLHVRAFGARSDGSVMDRA